MVPSEAITAYVDFQVFNDTSCTSQMGKYTAIIPAFSWTTDIQTPEIVRNRFLGNSLTPLNQDELTSTETSASLSDTGLLTANLVTHALQVSM